MGKEIKPKWCFRCICGYKGRNYGLFKEHTNTCEKFNELPKYKREVLLDIIFEGW